jgi:hypothetical protein
VFRFSDFIRGIDVTRNDSPMRTCHDHIALFHGTSRKNAEDILKTGFRALDLTEIVNRVSARHGFTSDELLPEDQFVTHRRPEEVCLSTSLHQAARYATRAGEAERMLLENVYSRKHPWEGEDGDDDSDGWIEGQERWINAEMGSTAPVVVVVWAPLEAMSEAIRWEADHGRAPGADGPMLEVVLQPEPLNSWPRIPKDVDFCVCDRGPSDRRPQCGIYSNCRVCRILKAEQEATFDEIVDSDWFACVGAWTRLNGRKELGEAGLPCPVGPAALSDS